MASKSKKSLPKFTIVKHPDPYNVLPKHEDVRVNVTIGYHTLRLKPGQSVRTNKAGNIFIVSMRGNITDTKLNVHKQPPAFIHTPLAGDVKGISQVNTSIYKTDKVTLPKEIKQIYSLWKIVVNHSKRKFKKGGSLGSNQLWKCYIPYWEVTLVATSEHPTSLLYILKGNEQYYPQAGRINKDIPLTSQYVKDCEKAHRELLSPSEKVKMSKLQASPEVDKLDKKGWRHLRHWQKQVALKELETEVSIAQKEMSRREDKVHISVEQSYRAMNLPVPERKDYKETYDEPKKKLSKEEIFAVARKFMREHNLDGKTVTTKDILAIKIY